MRNLSLLQKSAVVMAVAFFLMPVASASVVLNWPGLNDNGLGFGSKDSGTYGGNWAIELVFEYVGGDYIYAPGGVLTTFCIEWNESFVFGGDYGLIGTLADGAVNGGINGGNPDPLEPESAWLYKRYLEGYDFGIADANARAAAVQDAIWALEGESVGTDGDPYTPFVASHQDLIDEAALAVAGGWVNTQVKVLNMVGADGGNRQDVLALVPAPGAALLGVLGCSALVAVRRRFR